MKKRTKKKRHSRFIKLHNVLSVVKDENLKRRLAKKLQKLINLSVK